MTDEYQIVFLEKPAWDIIGQGINDFNFQHAGKENYQSLCFALQAPGGEILGGLIGGTHYGWLYISLLWLKEELRGLGYGSRLLEMSEHEARQRGAVHAYLDTFSFQAPEFYKKHGYQVFGTLPDFPPGHTRYYFTKDLRADPLANDSPSQGR